MEADTIKQAEMKEKVEKMNPSREQENYSKPNYIAVISIKGINTCAVPFVRYTGPFLKWTWEELKQMDERIRKLITRHKVLHLRNDVDRPYVSRKGGGGLTTIQDSVNASIQRVEDFVKSAEEDWLHTSDTNINRTKINRKQKCEEKQLNGHFKQLTSEISHEETWTWLRKGNRKRENESLLIAAQNNAIRTNYIKARIDKTQQNSRCWLCGKRNEMINHTISKCSRLAQKEYKTRYDWVGKVIHLELWKKVEIWPYEQMVYTQSRIRPKK